MQGKRALGLQASRWARCGLLLVQMWFGAAALAAQPLQTGVPPLFGSAGISAQAVKQGQLGSCYFHASIASIAGRNPAALRAAIRDAGNNMYTVRFVDGRSETVGLDDAMFGRQNRFDLSDGLWVTILLRGLAQSTMRQSLVNSISAAWLPASAKATASAIVRNNDALLLAYDRAVRTSISQDGTIDRTLLRTTLDRQMQALQVPVLFSKPMLDFLDAQGFFEALAKNVQGSGELFGAYRAVGQGGLVSTVFAAFLGPAQDVSLRGVGEAASYLRQMQRDSLPMVATTGETLDHPALPRLGSPAAAPDWWIPQHAYTVLSFDPGSNQVTLRNPWGRKPDPAGIFTISLSEFVAAYPRITVPRE